MRAMHIVEYGRGLTLCNIEPPVPGPGEIQIKVHACGVNFADTLMVSGKYQEKPELPFSPGMEVCGTIESAGPGVTGLRTGERVACYSGSGGFAEYLTASAGNCVKVPDEISDTEAAGFLIAYGTSHVALGHRAALKAGENLLVLGASGGVGLTAVELGRLMGANVIAVARGPDKCAVARDAGADHVFDNGDDIRAEVKALGGADVVYDPVGGELFDAALRSCNPLARLIPIGFASGKVPQIPANILLVKNLAVHGLYWGAYAKLDPDVLTGSIKQLLDWYAEGKLRPRISHVLPLERAEAALDLLRNRTATGKVVVTVY